MLKLIRKLRFAEDLSLPLLQLQHGVLETGNWTGTLSSETPMMMQISCCSMNVSLHCNLSWTVTAVSTQPDKNLTVLQNVASELRSAYQQQKERPADR